MYLNEVILFNRFPSGYINKILSNDNIEHALITAAVITAWLRVVFQLRRNYISSSKYFAWFLLNCELPKKSVLLYRKRNWGRDGVKAMFMDNSHLISHVKFYVEFEHLIYEI
jgi:hypothetical protein